MCIRNRATKKESPLGRSQERRVSATTPVRCAACIGGHQSSIPSKRFESRSSIRRSWMRSSGAPSTTWARDERSAGGHGRSARSLQGDGPRRPLDPAELAAKTGTAERMVREWLNGQAASGYVTYDAATQTLHAAGRAGERSPTKTARHLCRGSSSSRWPARAESKITEAFRAGRAWGGTSTIRMFSRDVAVLPARLQREPRQVLDSGDRRRRGQAAGGRPRRRRRLRTRCIDHDAGEGVSEVDVRRLRLPRTSIEAARQQAAEAGVEDRVHFRGGRAPGLPGHDYDRCSTSTACTTWATRKAPREHVRRRWLPRERGWSSSRSPTTAWRTTSTRSGASTTRRRRSSARPPRSRRKVAAGLGAQAGEARLREVATRAGFRRFRRATETPFNLIFEGRP